MKTGRLETYAVTVRGAAPTAGQGIIRAVLHIKASDDVDAAMRAKAHMVLKFPDRPVSSWRVESAEPLKIKKGREKAA